LTHLLDLNIFVEASPKKHNMNRINPIKFFLGSAVALFASSHSLPAAEFTFFDVNGTLVASTTRTTFTSSTIDGAYTNLATAGKPRPANNDLLQTLHGAGHINFSSSGANLRTGQTLSNVADAPGTSNGGNTLTFSTDTYGNSSTRNFLDIRFNNPGAALGYDLSGIKIYILNIFSSAADMRNEFLLSLQYSTIDNPTTFTTLGGAFQRFEDPDNKHGNLLEFQFNPGTVTGVHTLRLVDELGTDGTRSRAAAQATNFQEIDIFGVATPSSFATWAAANITNPADRDPLDDGEFDGLVNLLEYAVGTNPQASTGSILNIGNSAPHTLGFVRAAGRTDINILVQSSPDLAAGNWTTIATSTLGGLLTSNFGGDIVIADPNNGTTVAVTDNRLPNSDTIFYRIEVIKP